MTIPEQHRFHSSFMPEAALLLDPRERALLTFAVPQQQFIWWRRFGEGMLCCPACGLLYYGDRPGACPSFPVSSANRLNIGAVIALACATLSEP